MKRSFVKIEWEEAAESFMVDFYFETAPDGHRDFFFALGKEELHELSRACVRALLGSKSPAKKKTVKTTTKESK